MAIEIGEKFLHYEILQYIGAGGTGEVYKVRDERLDRVVAIKFLTKEATSPIAQQRFMREAQTAANLSHSNIATIYDVGEMSGQFYLVMEYCEGCTLSELIQRSEIPITQAIDIAIQILAALQVAHSNKIIHRDIKSSNIIVTNKGRVIVLDFGIAKFKRQSELLGRDHRQRDVSFSIDSLTGPDEILGTANFISPEQALKEHLDERSDIFSFGVVCYHMLTGRLPFEGKEKIDVLVAIIKANPIDPTKYRRDLPIKLAEIILRCLAKKASDRFSSARKVRLELQQLAKELSSDIHNSSRLTDNWFNKIFQWIKK